VFGSWSTLLFLLHVQIKRPKKTNEREQPEGKQPKLMARKVDEGDQGSHVEGKQSEGEQPGKERKVLLHDERI
jgi:hypothetical protein